MMGQDSNRIFPEIPREEEYSAGGPQMMYRGPGATAHGTVMPTLTAKEMEAVEARMMQQLKDFDMGCTFHDTPDGRDGNGQGKYPASAAEVMAQYGRIEAQAFPTSESNGPIWAQRNYTD
jgi:hypothetical protein